MLKRKIEKRLLEWIVLDKNNNENKLLLLSKNGFDVIHNYALTNKIKKLSKK